LGEERRVEPQAAFTLVIALPPAAHLLFSSTLTLLTPQRPRLPLLLLLPLLVVELPLP